MLRVFRIQAHLDGVAAKAHLVLLDTERFTRRDEDLMTHEIKAGDRLRHGMLHLQARVHLQEVELAIFVHDELNRARVGVSGSSGNTHGGAAHLCTPLRCQGD